MPVRNCKKGTACGATCIRKGLTCRQDLSLTVQQSLSRLTGSLQDNKEKTLEDFKDWAPLAQGNNGAIKINKEGTRVVKIILDQGEFGPHEQELAKKMGQLGHSPKVFSTSNEHMEMALAAGKTIWKSYAPGEGEAPMNPVQSRQAGNAIRDLHRLGYYHGDMHAMQFLVDKDKLQLVDYGLARPISSNPVKVMQDLAKMNAFTNFLGSEGTPSPYVAVVRKYLPHYKEITGDSKAAKNKRLAIAQLYLNEINQLET